MNKPELSLRNKLSQAKMFVATFMQSPGFPPQLLPEARNAYYSMEQAIELHAACKNLIDKYNSMPDGILGKGLINGDFMSIEEILNRK